MATITYREIRDWPGKKTDAYRRTRAPFKAHATRLWDLLERELDKLNAKEVTLSGYWRARDFKRDGGIYADARPSEPGVLLEFVAKGVRYAVAADRFLVWLDNVDAIGRSLEALRMIDRYGVTSGQQYEGFKAIPAKASVGTDEKWARETIATWSGVALGAQDNGQLAAAIKVARLKAHPDKGGNHEAFVAVNQAADFLQPRS